MRRTSLLVAAFVLVCVPVALAKTPVAVFYDGAFYKSGETVWQGRVAMRISVSCWATTDADVEKSIEAIIRVSSRV